MKYNITLMSEFNLNKGSLIPIIMQLLSENKEMYGYQITQYVKKITNGKINITEGALYPALHKLEADSLLKTQTKQVDGRLRKYYSLTEKGTEESVEIIEDLRFFLESLQQLLQPKIV